MCPALGDLKEKTDEVMTVTQKKEDQVLRKVKMEDTSKDERECKIFRIQTDKLVLAYQPNGKLWVVAVSKP